MVTFSDLSDTKPASLSLEAETPQPSSSYAPANLPVTSAGKDGSLLTTVAIESKQPLRGGLHSTLHALQQWCQVMPHAAIGAELAKLCNKGYQIKMYREKKNYWVDSRVTDVQRFQG